MIPKTDKNKDNILCPVCDGMGYKIPEEHMAEINDEIISMPKENKCLECKGTGYLPIIKTK